MNIKVHAIGLGILYANKSMRKIPHIFNDNDEGTHTKSELASKCKFKKIWKILIQELMVFFC